MLGRVGRVNGAGSGGRYGEKSRVAQAAPAAILAVVVALGVGLGVLHNRWSARGRPDPALAGIRTAAYPFQFGAARTAGAARTGWSWVFPGKDLGAENAKLAAEVARLRQENEGLRGAADEAARLREALQFSRAKAQPPVMAEVIGLLPSPVFDSIIVGKGARDGVRPKAVARTAAGLVGQVTEVGPLTCQVMLLSDANAQVGGVVMRGGKRMGSGIVRGQGRFEPLQMVYLRRDDDIKPGDKVVSSGYGGVFPRRRAARNGARRHRREAGLPEVRHGGARRPDARRPARGVPAPGAGTPRRRRARDRRRGAPQAMSDEQQQPGALSVGLFVLSLFVAVGIQSVLPGALAGAGVGAPDLVLVLVLVAALFTDAGTGALIGFAGGLLTAAVVGENGRDLPGDPHRRRLRRRLARRPVLPHQRGGGRARRGRRVGRGGGPVRAGRASTQSRHARRIPAERRLQHHLERGAGPARCVAPPPLRLGRRPPVDFARRLFSTGRAGRDGAPARFRMWKWRVQR
jgi:rod shape-determining protein MreC